MLLGDFNNIVNMKEKVGGNININIHMINFNNFLNEGNLISISTTGVPFTWSNGHKDNTIIFERLDKVIANMNWLNSFPSATLHNYPIFGSDHSPILLETSSYRSENNLGGSSFKFEVMWLSHPRFKLLLEKLGSIIFLVVLVKGLGDT